MKKLSTLLILLTLTSSGCATGVGCAAGALTGAGLGTIASFREEVGPSTVAYVVSGAAFGAVTGCVAGLFAGNKGASMERERAAREAHAAAPQESSKETP